MRDNRRKLPWGPETPTSQHSYHPDTGWTLNVAHPRSESHEADRTARGYVPYSSVGVAHPSVDSPTPDRDAHHPRHEHRRHALDQKHVVYTSSPQHFQYHLPTGSPPRHGSIPIAIPPPSPSGHVRRMASSAPNHGPHSTHSSVPEAMPQSYRPQHAESGVDSFAKRLALSSAANHPPSIHAGFHQHPSVHAASNTLPNNPAYHYHIPFPSPMPTYATAASGAGTPPPPVPAGLPGPSSRYPVMMHPMHPMHTMSREFEHQPDPQSTIIIPAPPPSLAELRSRDPAMIPPGSRPYPDIHPMREDIIEVGHPLYFATPAPELAMHRTSQRSSNNNHNSNLMFKRPLMYSSHHLSHPRIPLMNVSQVAETDSLASPAVTAYEPPPKIADLHRDPDLHTPPHSQSQPYAQSQPHTQPHPQTQQPKEPQPDRERRFECPECAKRFLRRQDLSRHSATHLNGFKPFHCDHCGTGFTRQDALHRHGKAKKCAEKRSLSNDSQMD